MRLSQLFICAGLTVFGCTALAQAHHHDAETPHIYATAWGVTLAHDGGGFYNDFARFTLGPDLANSSYVVSPYKRAMREFRTDKESCVYPKSVDVLVRTNDWTKGDTFIESDAMLRSPLRIFSRKDLPAISSTKDLAGLKLGYALGSRVPQSLGQIGVDYEPIADEEDKAKMLLSGTVDAIVANMPDAYFVFKKLGSELPAYDPNYDPVPVPRIRIVCHDNKVNRKFIKNFNARLKTLKKNKDMAKFLQENGLEPSQFLP